MYYSRSKNIAFSKLDGEICIFHSESGEYFNLNCTGSFIWDLIVEKIEEDDLMKSILDSYQGNINSIRNEVNEFLKKGLDLEILDASNEWKICKKNSK